MNAYISVEKPEQKWPIEDWRKWDTAGYTVGWESSGSHGGEYEE
jgi:hypothetical protein